jgi:putative phage-type endonuclease
MKTLDVKQGSKAWAEARAMRFTASEAPAMMGASKYQSRNDLLKQKATGLVPEVSDAQQRLFDKGHAAEAAARPIAERIIGEEIYPVTAVSDEHWYLLASFDGITLMEDLCWENKLYSQKLDDQINAGELEPHYYWQLEQQLLVSGAARCLFMCSDGSEGKTSHLWYEPVPGRAEQLLAGWDQFRADLDAYEHKDSKPAAKASPVMDLPSVSVQISGELVIVDNFDAFETALIEFIDNRLISKPQTDQDFADLEGQIKVLKKAEGALDAAESQLLSQVSTVDQLKRTKDLLHKLARDNRLRAEKLVKSEKEARKVEILQAAKQALSDHIDRTNASLKKVTMPTVHADFAGAMKGKRTISSLQSAADDELARVKIEVSRLANEADINLDTLDELAANHRFLFSDLQHIVWKQNDDFTALVKTRIADHEQAEAERREREEAQLRERLEREQAAKHQAELEAQRQAIEAQVAIQDKAEPVTEPAPHFIQPTSTKVDGRRDQVVSVLPPTHGIACQTIPDDQREHAPMSQRRFEPRPGDELITITQREYDELMSESRMLAALMAQGVDQWGGYDRAREELGLSEASAQPF